MKVLKETEISDCEAAVKEAEEVSVQQYSNGGVSPQNEEAVIAEKCSLSLSSG